MRPVFGVHIILVLSHYFTMEKIEKKE